MFEEPEAGTVGEERQSTVGYAVFPSVLQGLGHPFLWKIMQKHRVAHHHFS